jgi:hypothetical protein
MNEAPRSTIQSEACLLTEDTVSLLKIRDYFQGLSEEILADVLREISTPAVTFQLLPHVPCDQIHSK